VTIANLTTGDPSWIVAGRDRWRLTITDGAPNQNIVVTAQKDGGLASSSAMGSTDSAGAWSTEGTSSTGDIGSWVQLWRVGGTVIGALTFRIAADPAASTMPQTNTTTTTSPPPASTTPATIVSGALDTLISALPDPIGQPMRQVAAAVQTATADVPSVWLWVGAIGAAVLYFRSSGRKR
jgi:hypothetical protein